MFCVVVFLCFVLGWVLGVKRKEPIRLHRRVESGHSEVQSVTLGCGRELGTCGLDVRNVAFPVCDRSPQPRDTEAVPGVTVRAAVSAIPAATPCSTCARSGASGVAAAFARVFST